MKSSLKIPKSFVLFASTYNVTFDNEKCLVYDSLGLCNSDRKSIILSNEIDYKKLTDDIILDTFYHEKVHAILKEMGEYELDRNEKFIDIMAKLLRQSDETSKY